MNRLLALLSLSLLGAAPALATGAASLWSAQAPQLLSVEQAFALLPAERGKNGVQLSWNIAPGTYLYRERIRVELLEPQGLKTGALQMPDGIAHRDEHFGDVHIFRGLLQATLPLHGLRHNALRLRIHYQGCADAGICYPPQSVEQTVLP
ncbi:Disulphide bond corrector protein DsbC [Solimonas aquatica]|uniref:Disulphide bond corrector protein DsbC n=1 Tax=Solimonas aquatica TaxID=489703 RepID=A0A1H9LY83_9GAMM|nr:protein-disulfide reductase DsbD N-terminal domain-containing protein [Solimonas aquatica]SER15783.1 Disulphide bond corrector protein DsbC [Solimonas aquatica]